MAASTQKQAVDNLRARIQDRLPEYCAELLRHVNGDVTIAGTPQLSDDARQLLAAGVSAEYSHAASIVESMVYYYAIKKVANSADSIFSSAKSL